MTKSTIDSQEVAKFAELSSQWWNVDGPLRTLHDINPPRLTFIEQYATLEDKRILDVGTGGGILAEAMAGKGAKVTGLDVNDETLQVARKHAHENNLVIEYVNCPIEEFKARAFDTITCMEMLEHVPDPAQVIQNCSRLLKKNGYLFLSTINRTPLAYATVIVAAEYLLELLPRQTHDFKKFIKPSELAAIARKVGLDPIGISGLSYNPITRQATLKESTAGNYLMGFKKAD
ncbi:3-demethylubiquinone-9 3-methyltransferase (plasmid) [Legionella adelaidensis]|uniref:Ubiquinone biosynthesis O-methyltransferase n=1 Tax=Legionella adelaidensis TaxID=45056 RepID=A0A0W0R4G8_9GAMM|nr:bifunctional 2-polyprenyl-6-hydroxyphenol methylase/3-demethylubiquinol 3-O-methyltransferase UbiG [Legionella adelaidensis]KTC65960.1 3-demethylubiquinone-9 3-methyltransferase [Legionella adelaidensis]VEH86284.1 3-demethylubiquinone-9 3-methyltransferase [Legionella adelaidensis]